jgi:Mn-dependent DtxR family transcriptional regulator
VQLTQIQDEVISTAHSEGRVDPTTFARLLRHDLEDVHAAISDLVDRGLAAAAEGDTYCLTDQGETVHRAREETHRAAVVSRTASWQRR